MQISHNELQILTRLVNESNQDIMALITLQAHAITNIKNLLEHDGLTATGHDNQQEKGACAIKSDYYMWENIGEGG